MGGLVYRALLICNSNFPEDKKGLPKLFGPVRDGLALYGALTDQECGLFNPANVEVLFDADAQEIKEAAERFFTADVRYDDVLLFYYSGHGRRFNRNLYFCGRDAVSDRIASTGVSAAVVNDMMEVTRAATKIVILDCCHAGAFKGKAEAVSPEFFAGAGRYVMTASAASEQAADSAGRGQPSPFTQVLVDGLLFGAQGSHETGQLGAHELYQYVFKELPEKFPRPQERASGMGDTPLARRKTKSFTQPIAGHEVAPKGLIRPAGEDAATGSGAPMSSPIAQALGVSRRRAGEYSIGDYHAWKAVMLLDLLVAIFGFLSWQTWLLEPYGLSGGDVEAVLFFSAVLAVLSFLLASSEGLTLAYLARKFKRATGVRGGSMREVPGYVRKEILERRSVVMVRLVGNIVGCFFGLAWFVALTSLSFRADAYSLFMATLGALCFISLLRLVKMGDALFIAGALISFLGIFPKQGDLGYDAGEFGFGASLQGMAFLAMLCAWLFRLSNKALFLAAGLALIPAAIAYPAYQLLVGISLAGVTLAFIGVLMGDGVPLEEDGRSPVGAVIHRLGGGR
ncbi:caspase family protein [Streptomyces sp900105245]|uniref:Caspase family protein n=1 Tax=Streptomyces sp. 900105245 TaxID=3154379 RepID=A0ABV1UC36_9ACTN